VVEEFDQDTSATKIPNQPKVDFELLLRNQSLQIVRVLFLYNSGSVFATTRIVANTHNPVFAQLWQIISFILQCDFEDLPDVFGFLRVFGLGFRVLG